MHSASRSTSTLSAGLCKSRRVESTLPEGEYGDVKVKKFLNNVLQETLEPIRNRRKELEKDIPAIYEMLKKGSEEAEKVAARTWRMSKQP